MRQPAKNLSITENLVSFEARFAFCNRVKNHAEFRAFRKLLKSRLKDLQSSEAV